MQCGEKYINTHVVGKGNTDKYPNIFQMLASTIGAVTSPCAHTSGTPASTAGAGTGYSATDVSEMNNLAQKVAPQRAPNNH